MIPEAIEPDYEDWAWYTEFDVDDMYIRGGRNCLMPESEAKMHPVTVSSTLNYTLTPVPQVPAGVAWAWSSHNCFKPTPPYGVARFWVRSRSA